MVDGLEAAGLLVAGGQPFLYGIAPSVKGMAGGPALGRCWAAEDALEGTDDLKNTGDGKQAVGPRRGIERKVRYVGVVGDQ